MAVAKIMEITSGSPESFDHALKLGLQRAAKTINNIQGAWVKDQYVQLDEGRVKEYRVDLKVTFVLSDTK